MNEVRVRVHVDVASGINPATSVLVHTLGSIVACAFLSAAAAAAAATSAFHLALNLPLIASTSLLWYF